MKAGVIAKRLEEVDGLISSAQDLAISLEGIGADADMVREQLSKTLEKDLLENYGAPTLARYIVKQAFNE